VTCAQHSFSPCSSVTVVLFLVGAADKTKTLADLLIGSSLPKYAGSMQHDIDRTEQTRRKPAGRVRAGRRGDDVRVLMRLPEP
jgi:hypothetical protein